MKRTLFLTIISLIALNGFSQNYNWYKTEGKVIEQKELKASSSICGLSEGCFWEESERASAVQSFMNCMAAKADVIIDENQFDYAEYDFKSEGGMAYCWGYLHHPNIIRPIVINLHLNEPPRVCGMAEGCYWTSEERSAAVAAFAGCMSVKASILVDANDFEYDDYDYHEMGTAYCWGYAHHSSVMLPAIVELKP